MSHVSLAAVPYLHRYTISFALFFCFLSSIFLAFSRLNQNKMSDFHQPEYIPAINDAHILRLANPLTGDDLSRIVVECNDKIVLTATDWNANSKHGIVFPYKVVHDTRSVLEIESDAVYFEGNFFCVTKEEYILNLNKDICVKKAFYIKRHLIENDPSTGAVPVIDLERFVEADFLNQMNFKLVVVLSKTSEQQRTDLITEGFVTISRSVAENWEPFERFFIDTQWNYRQCNNLYCGHTATQMKHCSRCHMTWYCDRWCQREAVRMPVGGHDNAECLALKAEYKLNKDLKRFMKDFF
jgi:hypothetical protein